LNADPKEFKLLNDGVVEPVGLAQQNNSLARLTAKEFLVLLLKGDIQAIDYAKSCADIIDAMEPKLNAWAWYDRERFEAIAKLVDQGLTTSYSADKNELPSHLAGVPVGVKDIFNTEDMPTSHGSHLFSNYTPGNDARVVATMRRNGAIMAGKTVTAEFAVHTPNGTRNPHDLSRSSGTSSSGSAVAVATAMVPVALASQTAGSIIRPASYCGIFGFKPSYGTIPRTAMLKTTDTLDTVGFMTRSVSDLSLMFDVLRVRGPNYPIVDRALSDSSRLGKGARRWRVGVLEGPKSDLIAPAVRSSFEKVLNHLTSFGCELTTLRLTKLFDSAHDTHETIYRRSLCYYFRMEWESSKHDFSPRLAEMISGGKEISTAQYLAALSNQVAISKSYEELLENVDVVICPSTADEAPVGLDSEDIPDHCLIFTMCYAPSISIPMLHGSSGLPVGLQVASRRFNDYDLLEFSEFLCCSIS
jgi:Asp-tRNA(Asn)/Glu-tRNA(Gln) amidotransferase A subunit family amidase